MANGDTTQGAFDQASQVPSIKPDTKERVFSALRGLVGSPQNTPQQPGALEQAIEKHHQQRLDEARMHKRTASQALGILTYGKNPETGADLTEDEKRQYMNEYNSAKAAFTKVAGVNKETKAAIDRNFQLVEAMSQQQIKKRQGSGQYAFNVGEGGVTANPEANVPPPVPQSSSAAAGPQGGGPPQVPLAGEPPLSERLPFLAAQAQERHARQSKLDDEEAAFKQRDDFIKRSGIDTTSLAAQEYRLTGKIASSAVSRGKLQKGPLMQNDDGLPEETYFDPSSGDIFSEKTHEKVPDSWQRLSPQDLASKTVNLMTPDGPRMMFRKGNKVYDNHGNLQDGELVPLIRGMIPTSTDREVMGFDAQGNPTKYLLRSTRSINLGGVPNVPSPTAQGTAATPSAAPKGTAAPKSAQATGGSGGGGGSRSPRSSVFPAGPFMQLSKGATSVDQARNSLVGDNIEQGEVGGLAKDLAVFKDPESMRRIGDYLQLIHNQVAHEGDAIAHGPVTTAVSWWAGLPQTIIDLQQGALRDQYAQLTPDDRKFVADYFRVMGTMGGMRASTGMPGYQWAFSNMYNEMPTPGKVNDYDDAVRRVKNYVNETNVVSKRNKLVPKVDIDSLDRQIRGGGPPMLPKPKGDSKTSTFQPF